MDSMMGPGPSQAIKLGSNISTSSTPPAGDISPAIGRFKVVLKVNFHVEFDLGREDEAQPIRMTIPKDEPYDKFLSRLRNIFHGDSFERSLRRWEYVLVNRQYEKAAPLPLTSPNTYYAMISELLSTRSRWRHALVRRSHLENPIIRAVVEGKFHLTPASRFIVAAAPDISLPGNLLINDASKPGISIINTPPVADASSADAPMPDAPTDEATPEVLTSTPSSRARVVEPASANLLSRTPSPGTSFDKYTPHPSTPSTPVASARGRQSSRVSSPLVPALRAQDLMQPYSPLMSSPLKPITGEGGRRSALPSSPTAPVTISPKPTPRSSPLAPVATWQSPISLESSPLATDVSMQPPRIKFISPLTSSAIAQRPAISLSSIMASVEDASKELSSMLATAATKQNPAKKNASFELPVTDAPTPSIKLSAPSVPAPSARDASLHASSPSMQLTLPITPTASAQAPPTALPFVPDPSTLQSPGSTGDLEERNSPLASARVVPRSLATPSIPSKPASSPAPAPELFQRSLNLPPRHTFTSTPREAPPAKPTLILPPRRPLRIISRQRLNHGTEYNVQWNNGRRTWEPHDSLYRDYPAFVDRYLGGQR